MAKIETTTKLRTTDNVELFNMIRTISSPSFQDRIPVATQKTLEDIGENILNYQPDKNEFINTLVNRIGLVLVKGRMYTNPLKPFKKGMLEWGEVIEEIFSSIVKAKEYDPLTAESELFKREIPNVDSTFHKINSRVFYKTTVQSDSLKMAFTSSTGFSDLISKIVEELYSSMEVDEFLEMKNIITEDYKANNIKTVEVTPITDRDSADNFCTIVKEWSNNLTFMNDTYSLSKKPTFTPKDKQILIMNTNTDANVDVRSLATAFNLDYVNFMGQRVLVDNFGEGAENVVAMLVDKDYFLIYDTKLEMGEIYNPQGLYWNYTLHKWSVFSRSPYANAIAFVVNTNEG